MTVSEKRGLRVVMLLENNPYPADVRVRNEAESLVRAGHRVAVIAPRGGGEPRREIVAGVEVERYWLPAGAESVRGLLSEYAVAHAQLYARASRRLLRGVDVVHLHNPPDTLFGVALMARLVRCLAVYDHHDLSALLFEDKFGPSPVARLLRASQRASVRAASLVIATNESQRDDLLSRVEGRPRPVVVVRNGPREGTLSEAGPPRRGALKDPHLVFLGTVAAQDGVDDLPGLMRLLIDRHDLTDARMTVVGDGPRRGELEAAFARAGLERAVEITGWVPHQRVPGILASADICVDPAGCSPLNHASTMIKIGEYLASRRPVVAYGLVETRRTAQDAALYASCGAQGEFAALVARLADDSGLRADLAARGARRARELTWERSEEVLLRAYDGLADRVFG